MAAMAKVEVTPTAAMASFQILSAAEQVESSVLWPPLHADQYRQTVFAEEGVFCTQQPDGIYKATLGSAVNGKECQATWRVAVPTDIVDVSYGVVATNRSSASCANRYR